MPLQQTTGNVTTDAYGGGVAAVPNYIEDVFSTYLYGTSTTSVPNGIDISGKGALIWLKSRANDAGNMNNALFDSARGFSNILYSNTTGAQIGPSGVIASTSNNGFTLGGFNNGSSYASWTFRKQPKFFDVVTWSGDGTDDRAISHNLGSTPGCIIVKRSTSSFGTDWAVYHRSLGVSSTVYLNKTNAATGNNPCFGSSSPTSTTFTVTTSGGNNDSTNWTGGTYVAYLFAHNAGGFGLTGTDNVISCGSFTTDGSANATVELGWEPQWVMTKTVDAVGEWYMADTMRGWLGGVRPTSNQILYANRSNAEANSSVFLGTVTATGFRPAMDAGTTSIYIAIRRGPMKVPTSGTSVFSPNAQTTTAPTTVTTNFPVDLEWWRNSRTTAGRTNYSFDRLRGGTQQLRLNTTDAEQTDSASYSNYFDSNTAFKENFSGAGQDAIFWSFRRAPSFFDEVCYTGNATSGATQTHNLGVVPEMMIVKNRSAAGYDWFVYHKNLTSAAYYLNLNSTSAESQYWNAWNSTQPTSSVFTIGNYSAVNASGNTYVAYLFASCLGVSKVGSYTGTGTTQTINCGFTGGARFVMIKRTDSTGDWYVWDTARGMVSGTDPSLLLNSTAAEVNANSIYTTTGGFQIVSTAAGINASGGTYIFLAIA